MTVAMARDSKATRVIVRTRAVVSRRRAGNHTPSASGGTAPSASGAPTSTARTAGRGSWSSGSSWGAAGTEVILDLQRGRAPGDSARPPRPPASATGAGPVAQAAQQRDRGHLLVGQLLPAEPGLGPGGTPGTAVQHPLGRYDEVDRHVVVGRRDLAGRPDLQLVDGRHDDGAGPDQAGRGRQRELEE